MSFLDAVNKIMDKPEVTSLTGSLTKYIDEREDTYGKDDCFHPSHLYYMCPRCEVYRCVLPKGMVPEDKPDMMTRVRFDIGHALHWWYQNKYLGQAGILKGTWRCVRCNEVRDGFYSVTYAQPWVCAHGEEHRWEYVEPALFSKEWNIKGKADGIIEVDGEDCVMDLKTCKPSLFGTMKKPWPSAISQVQIYMWILGIKQGLLVYIDKSAEYDVPVKEFPVEYSIDTINDVKGKISLFNLSMDTRTLPDCLCRKKSFRATCSEVEATDGFAKAIKKWENGGKKKG